MKTNKSKTSYLILKIKDKKEIIIDVAGPEDDKMEKYEDFLDILDAAAKAGECRYAIYDFKYTLPNQETTIKSKLMFFLWNPDEAKVGQKMIYSSSQDGLKSKLEPGKKFENLSTRDEFAMDTWQKFLIKNDRGQ